MSSAAIVISALTFPLWASCATNKLIIFFLFFSANRLRHFMQITSKGDNLHEISKPIFSKKYKHNVSKYCLLKFLPKVLSKGFNNQIYYRLN